MRRRKTVTVRVRLLKREVTSVTGFLHVVTSCFFGLVMLCSDGLRSNCRDDVTDECGFFHGTVADTISQRTTCELRIPISFVITFPCW